MKTLIKIIFCFLAIVFFSCGDKEILTRMEHIKEIGDKNPRYALKMLDSLDQDIRDMREYTRMKYDLLKIRLNDKAETKHSSNKVIKKAVAYFDKKGSDLEKQEAHYYAGSVYRDLQDTPRALEHFNRSVEIAEYGSSCDSMLLRNAYSNLSYLFLTVQDNKNSLITAQKEYSLSKKIGKVKINSIIHLGNSYLDNNQRENAIKYLNEALKLAEQGEGNKDQLFLLLYDYAFLRMEAQAKACVSLIKRRNMYCKNQLLTIGEYYELINEPDSAAIFYHKAMKDGNDYDVYDSAKKLFSFYSSKGDFAKACIYGKLFVKTSEKLDFGKRQEMAATSNNKFQYHLDQRQLQTAEQERSLYMKIAIALLFAAVVIIFSITLVFAKKKNKMLKRQLLLADELKTVNTQLGHMHGEIKKKEDMLAEAKKNIAEKEDEIDKVNAELESNTAKLNATSEMLESKIRQSRGLLQILHKTELEANAADVVVNVKEAASGKKLLGDAEWKQLFAAVDSLYPDFREMLVQRCGKMKEQQIRVCYLIRIGLGSPQIKNVTDLPRTTIWRWVKECQWIADMYEREAGLRP